MKKVTNENQDSATADRLYKKCYKFLKGQMQDNSKITHDLHAFYTLFLIIIY